MTHQLTSATPVLRQEVKNSFGRVFYEIAYNPELDMVDTNWFGYASDNDLRVACEVGLQLHQEARCAYKLNDNSQFTGLWSESVAWLEKEWLPKVLETGLRYLAHVAKANSFGEAAGNAMRISKIGNTLEYGVFTTRPEALLWLQACQKANAPTSL